MNKFTVTRAEDGRQKWQDLTLVLMSRHSITTWPNEHHSRQLVHLTAWIIHFDLRISWRNTMADVFEKVELSFWRHFSPCLHSHNNATNQDCKALQRVVRLAERISGSTLPSLQGIYLKRCRSRAAKITKDSNHPSNHLFRLLPSGRRYRSLMAKTERLRKSFFPQAIRLLNTNSVP